jgi:hypothetical protein
LTSERKIRANRANARSSTGPQTARGRARAARNALHHALSLPVCSNARQVAEAQIDLRRVRYARHQFLSDTSNNQNYDSLANMRMKAKVMRAFLRPNPPDMSMEALRKFVTSTPQGPHKLATILLGEAKKLLAMDRYERRALSRRKICDSGLRCGEPRPRGVNGRGRESLRSQASAWLTMVCNGANGGPKFAIWATA